MKDTIIKHYSLRLICFVLAVCSCSAWSFARTSAEQTVKGTVSDRNGKGIDGVAITYSDVISPVFTDNAGRFSIQVNDGSSLFFSKSDFSPVVIKVTDNMLNLQIVMERLDEMEVFKVGYVDRNKYNLTSAVSTIKSADLEKSRFSTADNALAGKAAGLTVLKNAGTEPGYESSSIYIRGTGTFGSFRTPLMLVDDVERDINQIDINTIESVSVLKDGAATAQYGQRGANGALLVTTKRGVVGKPEINLMAQGGIQSPTRMPKFLGAKDYLNLYNKALQNDGLERPAGDRYNPAMYNGSQNPYLVPDVDWYNSFVRPSTPQQQYTLSVRGGSEAIRYFVLLSYMNQDGLYRYTDQNVGFNTNVNHDRFNVSSNIDAQINKNLTVALDLTGRIENRNSPNSTATDIFSTLSSLLPNAMPIQYEDGKLAGTSVYKKNPLGMIANTGYRQDRIKALQVKAQATQKLDMVTPGLSVKATVAFDGLSGYGLGKTASYATYELQPDNSYRVDGQNKAISLQQEKLYDYYQYLLGFNGGFSYARDFGKNAILADVRYYMQQLNKQGDNPAFARMGVNGRATYSYDKRYVADFSFAYDGSDEFAPGHRFGFFPSVSGAWIISNEEFLKNNMALTFLKLRASYGEAGNSNSGLDRYGYQSNWFGFDSSYGGYTFGSGFNWSDGAWEGRAANPDLTWETTRNLNVGIDAELFQKLSVSVDLFRNDRRNIICEMTNSPNLGAPYAYENIGSVLNQGVELALMHKNRVGKVNYFVQSNISFARNKITAMDEVEGLPEYQRRTGKPVSQLWGLQALGFYSSYEDIANSPISSFYNVKPGDIKYKNQNQGEDNQINIYDEIAIGKPTIPEWTMALSFGVDYMGFDLSALLSGVANRSVFLNNAAVWNLQNNNNATDLAYGAWEQGVRESNATYPRLTTENNLNNYRSSSFWIKNGNFLRLSNVELGYSIPTQVLQSARIKQVRFYVNGQNLFCFDSLGKYNLDPEVIDGGVTGYPNMRSVNFGVNIKF